MEPGRFKSAGIAASAISHLSALTMVLLLAEVHPLGSVTAPEGRLAAEPILIEASASAKGPALMQSAISALQACQPYAMLPVDRYGELPVDRYGEWKVLDLSFTPQDFRSAS